MKLKANPTRSQDYLAFVCAAGHERAVLASELKYGPALMAVAETMNLDDFLDVLTGRPEKVKETYPLEVWIQDRDNPGYLKWERNRRRREVVAAVEEALKKMGYYDGIEWISPSPLIGDAEIPKFDYAVVSRRVGPNEGEKVEVGVVSSPPGNKGQRSYFAVLTIKLFDKDLARLITDFLTDYLNC